MTPIPAGEGLLDVRFRRPPAPMKETVDFLHIKGFRVERSSAPLHHVVVVWMLGVLDGVKKIVVPSDATDIVWRTRALSRHHDRVTSLWNRRHCPFKDDVVLPAIPEVVLVFHPIFRPPEHLVKTNPPLILALDSKLRVWRPVIRATREKLMEMAVGPAHCHLKNRVQPIEGEIAGHLNPSPDRRPDASEPHLELIDQFTLRHVRVEFAYPPDSTARPTPGARRGWKPSPARPG